MVNDRRCRPESQYNETIEASCAEFVKMCGICAFDDRHTPEDRAHTYNPLADSSGSLPVPGWMGRALCTGEAIGGRGHAAGIGMLAIAAPRRDLRRAPRCVPADAEMCHNSSVQPRPGAVDTQYLDDESQAATTDH